MIRKIAVLSALAVCLPACVATTPVNQAAWSGMGNKTITHNVGNPPGPFHFFTADRVLGGALMTGGTPAGSYIMTGQHGQDIISANHVEDPSDIIGFEIARELADRYHLQQKDNTTHLNTQAIPGHYDVVVDAKTSGWVVRYYPTDWNNYRLTYASTLKVINRADNAVLASGACEVTVPEEKAHSYSYEQMVGNGAAGLKEALHTATGQCLQQIKEKIGLSS